jgi:hypothetical protein
MVSQAKPNYIEAIQGAVAAGRVKPIPGTLVHIAVMHDDWCAIFKGGVCNCDPDVETMRSDPR